MVRPVRWMLCLGVATLLVESAATQPHAQTATPVNVTVDATAPGAPLQRIWSNFGFDEVNYSTTPDGKALLATLAAANTAPVYVRTHFLLNTGSGVASLKWGSTNAYTEDAAGNAVYDWTLMDEILDTITEAGALPLVEIAFMPEALSVHPAPYQNTRVTALDGGAFYPPNDYDKWAALIRAWATHVKDRYPNVEDSWLWELWNEPDIGYWHGTFAEYAKLYDFTEAAVRAVLPNARVGGPAVTAPVAFFTQFLEHCATGTNAITGMPGTRLDLVSFHAKGGVSVTGGHVQMDLGNQMRLHRDGFNDVAAIPEFRNKPIYITEADPDGCAACPASQIPADAYRNSPAYGAYEVAMMKRTLELQERLGVNVGGLTTWAFTFPNTPYFAGYRALTSNGITMPVLGAFKLLGSLSGARLPVTSSGALSLDTILNAGVRGAQPDIDAMATLSGQQVQVLVWNYHDALVATAASPLHVTVAVPASFGDRVTVSDLRVDDSHGNAYTVWVAQGSPAAPSAAQLTELRQSMEPVPVAAAHTVDVVAGSVAVDFDLPRFGVSLLTLAPVTPVVDAAPDGPMIGDAAAGDGVSAPGGTPADATAPPAVVADLGPNGAMPGEAANASGTADAPSMEAPTTVDASGLPTDIAPSLGADAAASPRAGGSGCSYGPASAGTGGTKQALLFLIGLAASVASLRRRGRRA